MKEEDVIDDTSSQEISVKTLHHEMMVMSRSQPVTLVLCQVVPYLVLEGNEEHKERENYSINEDVPHPLIEDVLDDEDIDQME